MWCKISRMSKLSWDPWLKQDVSINHTSTNGDVTWYTNELILPKFHVMVDISATYKSCNTRKKVANSPNNIVTLSTHSINTEFCVIRLVISCLYCSSIQLLHKIARLVSSLWLSSNDKTWQYTLCRRLEVHNCNFNLRGIVDVYWLWCSCDNVVIVILSKVRDIKHMVWKCATNDFFMWSWHLKNFW